MRADAKSERAIIFYPIRGCIFWVNKEKNLIGKRVALKTNLGGNDALGGWRIIDSTVGDGRELRTVLTVKNHTVNSIWVRRARLTVKYDVTDGNLSRKGLTASLCANDA